MIDEEKEYWLSDIETGYRYKVTKVQHENYMKMWDMCYPKLDTDKCTPLLYGTGGDMERNSNDWSKWFYKNDNNAQEKDKSEEKQ